MKSHCNYDLRGRAYEEVPALLSRGVSGNALFHLVVKRVVAEGQYGPPALVEPYSGLEFLGDCFAGAWLVRSPDEQ